MNSATTRRVASLLRGEAKRKKLSTAEVARRAGAPYESTRRKLSGQGPLSLDELIGYSDAVGLEPEFVLSVAINQEASA